MRIIRVQYSFPRYKKILINIPGYRLTRSKCYKKLICYREKFRADLRCMTIFSPPPFLNNDLIDIKATAVKHMAIGNKCEKIGKD